MFYNRKSTRNLIQTAATALSLSLVLLIQGCDDDTTPQTLNETEFYFDEQLSSLSADGDSAFWLGSETGNIWHISSDDRQYYATDADRIYKVVSIPPPNGTGQGACWLGIRNSGLQKWHIVGRQLQRTAVYPIANKGIQYSVYDILIANNTLFAATSQGLYAMPATGDSLHLVYPHANSATALHGSPFVVIKLALLDNRYVLATTPDGVLRIDTKTEHAALFHQGENIYDVAVEDGCVYTLVEKCLYIDNAEGKNLRKVELDFSPHIYYKVQGTHYFLDENRLEISENLTDFVSIPLRRKIPTTNRNIIGIDGSRNFVFLVTKNALWRISSHLGIFNASGAVTTACSNGTDIYYVSTNNELYHQAKDETTASLVYKFSDKDPVTRIFAFGKELYYINNRNELKKIRIHGNYLQNQLFATPSVIFRSQTRITSAHLMKSDTSHPKIYLGIQDELIEIDDEGHADTVRTMSGKYATAFYSPENTSVMYMGTLNDGVFYRKGDTYHHIAGTERSPFIRDLIVTDDYRASLMMLTNHRIILPDAGDTTAVRSYNRLLYVNDTTFFALPDYGLYRYAVTDGGLHTTGKLFRDISFAPQAAFLLDRKLYLGSNIGVMVFDTQKENTFYWVKFNSNVPSLRLLMLSSLFILALVLILVLMNIKRRNSRRQLIRMSVDDLRRRLEGLTTAARQLGTHEKMAGIEAEINSIDINDKDATEKISRLSEQIMLKNRNVALVLLKHLEAQTMRISATEAYDRQRLLQESQAASTTDDIEQINRQIQQNETWLEELGQLMRTLDGYEQALNGTLVLAGINEGIGERIVTLRNHIRNKPLAEIQEALPALETEYAHIFSAGAQEEIESYIERRVADVSQLMGHDKVTDAVVREMQRLREQLPNADRLLLLRALRQVETAIRQLEIKEQIATEMNDYVITRNYVVRENEKRITKKFDRELEAEIASHTGQIVAHIEKLSSTFYGLLQETDGEILQSVFRFSSTNSQSVKVLVLLIANAKAKRTLIPGMLGIYGNLNPVISRLMNNKIKENLNRLSEYVSGHPMSLIYYVLRLVE